MIRFMFILFFFFLSGTCFASPSLSISNQSNFRLAFAENYSLTASATRKISVRLHARPGSGSLVVRQSAPLPIPGNFFSTEIIVGTTIMLIAYSASALGSFICSIGNGVFYRSTFPNLLRGWGIAGVVFGSLLVGVSSIYLGLTLGPENLPVAITISTIGAVVGLTSIGLGIHSILRAKGILSGKISVAVLPWFALGKNQLMINGVSFSGKF